MVSGTAPLAPGSGRSVGPGPEDGEGAALLETAAQHLVTRIPVALPEDTAGSIWSRLRGQVFDTTDAVYIVDQEGRLLGFLRLAELLRMPGEEKLGAFLAGEPPRVLPDEDQERVASIAIAYGIAAVPVTDPEGHLLGVVPPEALIDILRREHIEDLHRLTGILKGSHRAHDALQASPWHRARARLPWLLVGLAGSMLATAIMAGFEETLRYYVAIAFFVPGIVYLADAIGTQTEAIAVRWLSFSEGALWRLLWGELRTGLLIGLVLAALIYPAVWFAFGDWHLALTVSLGVLAAGSVSTSVGFFFPWALSRLGLDPAFGSGPVGTIIQDTLSILIYFAVVRWLLL